MGRCEVMKFSGDARDGCFLDKTNDVSEAHKI
jgi:hypothetical protein